MATTRALTIRIVPPTPAPAAPPLPRARSPQAFDVDEPTLEASFKALQKSVHPDRYSTRSLPEQAASAAVSSNLNVAYGLLRNPVARAQYLLQLHGVDAIGEGSGSGVAVAASLLMEVMEGRELLEDCAPGNAAAVGALLAHAEARVAGLLGELRAAFRAGDLRGAAAATVALQYATKLRAEAGEWRPRLDGGGGAGGGGGGGGGGGRGASGGGGSG